VYLSDVRINVLIPIFKDIRLLGVTLDNRLNFDAHIVDIGTYASVQLIGIVSNLFGHIGQFSDPISIRMPWENCFAVPKPTATTLSLFTVELAVKDVLCTYLGSKGSLIHGYCPFIAFKKRK